MNSALEKLLKEVWTAGFDAGLKTAYERTEDIPTKYKFEQFMEQIVEELTGETG